MVNYLRKKHGHYINDKISDEQLKGSFLFISLKKKIISFKQNTSY